MASGGFLGFAGERKKRCSQYCHIWVKIIVDNLKKYVNTKRHKKDTNGENRG